MTLREYIISAVPENAIGKIEYAFIDNGVEIENEDYIPWKTIVDEWVETEIVIRETEETLETSVKAIMTTAMAVNMVGSKGYLQ